MLSKLSASARKLAVATVCWHSLLLCIWRPPQVDAQQRLSTLCAGFVVREGLRPFCRGEAQLIRFADEFVVLFHEEEARRFATALPVRLDSRRRKPV